LARADEPNRFWDRVCELNQVAFVVGPDEEPSLEAGALLGAAVVVAAAVVGLDVVDVVLTGSCSLRPKYQDRGSEPDDVLTLYRR
jgi:hypothetical protein